MNADYIQGLRYKLQKRVRRLSSTGFQAFHFSLMQFLRLLMSNPMLAGIIEDLERRVPEADSIAEQIVGGKQALLFDDELEHAATSWFVLRRCIAHDNNKIESLIGRAYCNEAKYDDSLEYFKTYFLETLYEYIDEQIDDQHAILGLLGRYKQKCEWFQREQLYDLWKNDTSHGEKNLSLHLYEYLHEQGLDFAIEPSSASGEADLVAAQQTDYPLIADAKIFNPEKGKGSEYIAKGFNQVYLYTRDYNEPVGYLVIYKTCEHDLRFAVTSQTLWTPFVVHNNKTIFLITVDIFPHNASASKRGTLKTIEITEADLVRIYPEGGPVI